MGNCGQTAKKSTAEITPSDHNTITLYGPPNSPCTTHIQLALSYKPITLNFIPHNQPLTLIHKSDVVSGPVTKLLRYLDKKFPQNTVNVEQDWGKDAMLVVLLVRLQHCCISWHLEKVVSWVEDMATRGGSVRMEVRKLGKRFGMVVDVLVEHAQMEERVLFPVLEAHDRGLCKAANEEHARDLPLMNGIREEIKALGVMNQESPDYHESLLSLSSRLKKLKVSFPRLCKAANEEHARDLPLMNGIREEIKALGVMNQESPDYHESLLSLSSRLKKLKENCKHHFEEEENELLPLMEATELNKSQQEKIMQQSLDAMSETHSHMFRFFVEGLQPQDAMRYFELVYRYCDKIHV